VDKKEALSLAMNLGWTMLFSLLLPLLAGIWLDNKLNTAPLFILIGAGLGISAATVGVARMAMRTFRSVDGAEATHEVESNGEEEPD
jgi:F0F1-type ATP synthase assembly protein I